MRIVSLLPAATEIVWALGMGDDLVGLSHACDHPPAVLPRPVVTRPMDLARSTDELEGALAIDESVVGTAEPAEILADRLGSLDPDLVLTGPAPIGSGAPTFARDEALRAVLPPGAAVVTLQPHSLEGILHAIATIGAMTAAEDEAVGLVEILRERLADVEEVVEQRRLQGRRPPRVIVLERLDPPVAAGRWVPEQVRRAGGWEVLGGDDHALASTSWEAIDDLDPEMLLLAPRGLHLAEAVRASRAASRSAAWRELRAVRHGHALVLDAASYVSRPGPRVIDGIEMLAEIFDPMAFVDIAPAGSWVPLPEVARAKDRPGDRRAP